jgi:hypothetical protein
MDLEDRADLNRAFARCRNASGDVDGGVQVPGVDQEEPAELLPRLGEGTVGDEPPPVAHLDAGGRGNRL